MHDNTDATTVVFQVRTADGKNQVAWPRLAKTVWDFPKVRTLSQLRAVEHRLAHVYSVLQAGGVERVDTVVEKLDSVLLAYYIQHPAVPHLTAADLYKVTSAADGSSIRYGFIRPNNQLDFLPQFAASIVIPEHGEPSLETVIPPQ